MYKIIILSLLFSLAACSNSNDRIAKNAKSVQSKDGYRCETIKPIGSNIPKRVCSNAAERQALQEIAQKDLRSKIDVNTRQ